MTRDLRRDGAFHTLFADNEFFSKGRYRASRSAKRRSAEKNPFDSFQRFDYYN